MGTSRAGRTPDRVRRLAVLATNRNLIGICAAFFCFDYYW